MSIPTSNLVNVIPGVLGAGGVPLEFNGMILTDNSLCPAGAPVPFANYDAVAAFFGADSVEARMARVYFDGFNNASKVPSKLFFTFCDSGGGGNPYYTITITPDTYEVHWDAEGNMTSDPVVMTCHINRFNGYSKPVNVSTVLMPSWGDDFSATINGDTITSDPQYTATLGIPQAYVVDDAPDEFTLTFSGKRDGWGLGWLDRTVSGPWQFYGNNDDPTVSSNPITVTHDPMFFVFWSAIGSDGISNYNEAVTFDGSGNQINSTPPVQINLSLQRVGTYPSGTPLSINIPTPPDADWATLSSGQPLVQGPFTGSGGPSILLSGMQSSWGTEGIQGKVWVSDGVDTVYSNIVMLTPQ